MDPLNFITIRGMNVDIRAKKINNFYFRKEGEGENDFSLKYTDCDHRMKNSDDQRVWAATILGAVYQPIPADASVPISTSVLEVPTPTIETTPAIYVATSSAPSMGLGILSHGMRLIRLTEAKVKKLIKEFPAYVKEAIETALAPHKENLEAVREEQKSIRAQFQAIKLQLGRIEGGGDEGLPIIRAELQRITT
ncbi:hypothetical protein RND71_038225 [Anisodus tanguticus]|uniref:Uncharacterized protein n=1 Tax=Anisodus tanguticus TaxID=243964 RepID=A0AAE1R0B2_9SOLA|nr:hypothetical protein RND71_038225 [Anisodus tanguticus]